MSWKDELKKGGGYGFQSLSPLTSKNAIPTGIIILFIQVVSFVWITYVVATGVPETVAFIAVAGMLGGFLLPLVIGIAGLATAIFLLKINKKMATIVLASLLIVMSLVTGIPMLNLIIVKNVSAIVEAPAGSFQQWDYLHRDVHKNNSPIARGYLELVRAMRGPQKVIDMQDDRWILLENGHIVSLDAQFKPYLKGVREEIIGQYVDVRMKPYSAYEFCSYIPAGHGVMMYTNETPKIFSDYEVANQWHAWAYVFYNGRMIGLNEEMPGYSQYARLQGLYDEGETNPEHWWLINPNPPETFTADVIIAPAETTEPLQPPKLKRYADEPDTRKRIWNPGIE